MKFHLNRSGSLALKIVVRISLLVVLTCSTLTAVVLYFYRTSQEQQVTKSMERSGRDAIAAEVIFYDGVTVKEGFSRLPMWASSGRMEDRSTDLMQSA